MCSCKYDSAWTLARLLHNTTVWIWRIQGWKMRHVVFRLEVMMKYVTPTLRFIVFVNDTEVRCDSSEGTDAVDQLGASNGTELIGEPEAAPGLRDVLSEKHHHHRFSSTSFILPHFFHPLFLPFSNDLDSKCWFWIWRLNTDGSKQVN